MLSETEDEEGKRVVGVPALSPDFLIETYLDHQVSKITRGARTEADKTVGVYS